jgi:hypothetical protein
MTHGVNLAGSLEQNPKKSIDFFDKILLQHFESGAISYRPDDSVRSESALGAGTGLRGAA